MLNPALKSATPQYQEGAYLCCAVYNKPWEHPETHKKYTIVDLGFEGEVYGYLLLPSDRNDHDLKVVFRGTDPALLTEITEPGIKSALVNFEAWAPGFESFDASKEKVFNAFINNIKTYYGTPLPKLELSVCGHSQGGALAQLFVNEFLRQRLLNPDYINFQNLVMTVFNSPGVYYEIAEQCDALARYQCCLSQPLNIRANYGMIGGDPIQTMGVDMIFTNTPPAIAEVNVLKLDKGQEGAWKACLNDGIQWDEIRQFIAFMINGVIGSHPVENFTWNEHEPDKYQFYSNTIPETIENLRYELSYKTLVWPSIGYYIGRSFLLEAINTYHSLFNKTYNTTVKSAAGDLQEEQEDDLNNIEEQRPFLR